MIIKYYWPRKLSKSKIIIYFCRKIYEKTESVNKFLFYCRSKFKYLQDFSSFIFLAKNYSLSHFYIRKIV